MPKKNKKKIITAIITPVFLAGFFFSFYNSLNLSNNSNQNHPTTTFLNSRDDTTLNTKVVKKANIPDVSNYWAGYIFYEFSKNNINNSNSIYANMVFDTFLEVIDPVKNSSYEEHKNIKMVDFNDSNGTLILEASISPSYLNGQIIQGSSSPSTITITGFNKYNQATSFQPFSNYPTNLKPSQINETNIENYGEIINLPQIYASNDEQLIKKYTFRPNDALGILEVDINLSYAIIQDPSNATVFLKEANRTITARIENLATQPASFIPADNSTIDGSSIDVLASEVDDKIVRTLIYKNCKNLYSPFDEQQWIFDIKITRPENDIERKVTVSFKVYYFYDEKGLLVNKKDSAKTVTNVIIENLKDPINTALTKKKDGDSSILAQTVYEKTDKAIINEYIQIENPTPNDQITIRIKSKSFDNITGVLSLSLTMSNYYYHGKIEFDESPNILIDINNFKQVQESTITAKPTPNGVYATDVDFQDPNNQYYIQNFLNLENFPTDPNTTFRYVLKDVDNKIGFLYVDVYPSSWYDNKGIYYEASNTKQNVFSILVEDFATIKPTKISVNLQTTASDIISNIYASDVVNDTDVLKSYVIIEPSLPAGVDFSIRNPISKNSIGLLSFEVVLETFYNDKGILETNTQNPKTEKITINGFKTRLMSAFSRLDAASEVLPSDVNENNWQQYVSIASFPFGVTFSNFNFSPKNINGTLQFSAVPSKYYDQSGEEKTNTDRVFKISLNNMKRHVSTTILSTSNDDDKKMLPSDVQDTDLKKYLKAENGFDNTIDTLVIDKAEKNNISGNIIIEYSLYDYYDLLGNPVNNSTKPIHDRITIKGFYSVTPNMYLIPNSEIINVDPYDLIARPEDVLKYLSPIPQTNLPADIYAGPIIDVASVSVTGDSSELDQGIINVTYKINNYYDQNGKLIDKENTVTKSYGGFKIRNLSNDNNKLTMTLLIVIFGVIFLLMIVVCLGILFRRKKYYINENYDRGSILANETSIPTVINANDKMKKTKPRLIPLIKEIKPPKPLKQLKPIKQKQVKVKSPKQPILPGQRKREMIEKYNNTKVQLKDNLTKNINNLKDKISRTNLPINEPFEINNQWYYKNEAGKYFIANENNEWNETKRPKISRPKKQKVKKEKKIKPKKSKKSKNNDE